MRERSINPIIRYKLNLYFFYLEKDIPEIKCEYKYILFYYYTFIRNMLHVLGSMYFHAWLCVCKVKYSYRHAFERITWVSSEIKSIKTDRREEAPRIVTYAVKSQRRTFGTLRVSSMLSVRALSEIRMATSPASFRVTFRRHYAGHSSIQDVASSSRRFPQSSGGRGREWEG